ncbi:MAG: DUF1499 domain-containing protein [Sphingorhabdus sp.]
MQEDDKTQPHDQDMREEAVTTAADPHSPAVPTPVSAKGRNWGGKFVLFLGGGSILVALIGALGSGWGLWQFGFGFRLLLIAFGMAVAAVIFGFGIGWRAKRKGQAAARPLRWLGMGLGGALALWLASFAYTARTVPAIHDVSTDLADPPQFRMLAVRADNLDAIPGADDPDMKGMNPQQRWAALHAEAYGNIRSVRVAMPVADVIAKAERLAKERGWEIAIADPVEGRLEATETTRFFRFKDDVVVRVRPTEDAKGSIVDMRSISRVGVSDLGMNAKRVRAFLADLTGTNPAG